MEDFRQLKIEKIAGLPDDKNACGVFTRRITTAYGDVGTLVSTILIKGEPTNQQEHLKAIFEVLGEVLEEEGPVLDLLKKGGEKAHSYISEGKLDVCFANVFFLKNACFILRYNKKVKVFIYKPPKSFEVPFEIGSGPVKKGQLYVIATEQFFETFDTSSFSEASEVDLEDVIDGLATEITADENQSELAAAFIEVGESVQDISAAGKPKAAGVLDRGTDVNDEATSEADDAPAKNLGEEFKEEDKTLAEEAGNDDESLKGHVLEGEEKREEIDSRVFEEEEKGKKRFAPGSVVYSVLSASMLELKKLKGGDTGAVSRLRRHIVLVAVIAIIILGVSAFFTISGKVKAEKLKEFDVHVASASSKYLEAGALIELNRSKARDIFAEADKEIKNALSLFPDDENAKELAGKITAKLRETEELSSISFDEVLDLDSQAVAVTKSATNIYVFSNQRIYELDENGEEISDVQILSDVSRGFAFDSTLFAVSGGKVFKADFAAESSSELALEQGIVDMSVFLGNVYLLSSNQIHKYVPVEAGYAKSVDYLSGPETFGESSRIAIDGSVWVTNGSSVLKYLRGEKESFEISGITGTPGQLGEIYTSPDDDNIYVIDKTNSALLVVSKEGVYQKAYQSPEFSRVSDLLVDAGAGKLYIAVGDKLLSASL